MEQNIKQLRKEVCEELISYGATVPAEKIMKNDLSPDEELKWDLQNFTKCPVGFVNKTNYWFDFEELNPNLCKECIEFGYNIHSTQKSDRGFNRNPTPRFLRAIKSFLKHYKERHLN